MKSQRINIILFIVLFIVVATAIALGSYELQNQKKQMTVFKEEQSFLGKKLGLLTKDLDGLNTKLAANIGDIKAVQKAVAASDSATQEVTQKLSALSEQIENFKAEYEKITAKIDTLTQSMNTTQEPVKLIELGEVSVKKDVFSRRIPAGVERPSE